MVEHEAPATGVLWFSIIIAVYNDWLPLHECLQSLSKQNNPPAFEVIVVDDGSRDAAPASIQEFSRHYPLNLVRQPHAGIAAARNNGTQHSRGSVLLFTDADCRLREDCLARLAFAIADSPEAGYFQLRIVGTCSNLVGRAEHLRLIAVQKQLLEPGSHIRYLNTAGFAIRRSAIQVEELFDRRALRAEDTLLLADLISHGELPLFVANAVVEHAIPLSLTQCFRKDITSVLTEANTYRMIASRKITVRMGHRSRLGVLRLMWEASSEPDIGRSAWIVAAGRQLLQRIVSLLSVFIPRQVRVSE